MRLVALDGSRQIVVGRTPLVVGRHPGCDVRLGSLRISRLHCCLAAAGDEVVVRDLGSTNGLRINGRCTLAGRLKAGDTLAIAHVEFRVESGPACDEDALRTQVPAITEEHGSDGSAWIGMSR
jgi:pSer/pThr/pTyr-binding forkhead associated (FHA) protein